MKPLASAIERALSWTDHVIVRASVDAGMARSSRHHIPHLARAAEFLKSELRDGDLIIIEGRTKDPLSRVVFAQYGSAGCWTRACSIHRVWDVCDMLQPEFDLDQALTTRAPTSPQLGSEEV